MEVVGWALLAIALAGLATGWRDRAQREKVLPAAVFVTVVAAALLWVSGASDRIWEKLRRPPMPADEAQFVGILDTWAARYDAADNDIARLPLRAARAAELCALGLTEARDWTGRVGAIYAAGNHAGIDLAVTYRVMVGTTNNRVSEALAQPGQQTLIQQGTPLHATVATLRPGTAVRFSGTFFPSRSDCLRETSLTESGGMTEPRFDMRLTEIAPLL